MRKLRPFYAPDVLRQIYDHTYDHTQWREHIERVKYTTEIAQRLINKYRLMSVTDLSAGDGAIVKGLTDVVWRVNDISENGDGIEALVKNVTLVDLWICTETIEHLEAPWTVLEEIARKTKWLVLSCPLNEDSAIGNHEHYWSFTDRDVEDLLAQSGFADAAFHAITEDTWTYEYQIWTARSVHNA